MNGSWHNRPPKTPKVKTSIPPTQSIGNYVAASCCAYLYLGHCGCSAYHPYSTRTSSVHRPAWITWDPVNSPFQCVAYYLKIVTHRQMTTPCPKWKVSVSTKTRSPTLVEIWFILLGGRLSYVKFSRQNLETDWRPASRQSNVSFSWRYTLVEWQFLSQCEGTQYPS